MYPALADVDIEHVAHHFPHPFEVQVLPCVEIADKPFDVAAVAHRGTCPFRKVCDRTARALRSVGTVLRPYLPYRGYAHRLPELFHGRFRLRQRQAAIAAMVGAQFYDKVGIGDRFQSVPFMAGLPFGALAQASVPPRAVFVLRGRYRTVAAVLGILIFGTSFPEFGILGAKTGDFLFQGIQTDHERIDEFPVGQISTFAVPSEIDRCDANLWELIFEYF